MNYELRIIGQYIMKMVCFRKYVLWVLGSLFALFLLLSAVVYFAVLRDDERIKTIVVGELNKSLTGGQISVERMSVTFWSSFPHIALDFRNVRAMGPNPNDLEPLLEAKRLSLNFNLRDMLAKKYEVKRIDINGATVNIKLYADGTRNFDLWKSSDTTTSDFSFALNRVQFRNTKFNFEGEVAEQRYEMYFYRADAKGDFSANLQDITFSGDFHLDLLRSKGAVILAEKGMSLRTRVQVDNSTETVHISEGMVRLEDLNFVLSGFVSYSDAAPNLGLEVVGKNLNLQKFVRQLPAAFAQEIESYRTKGDFDFRMVLSGGYSQGSLPKIDAEWAFRDGRIYERNSKTQLNDVQFSGVFSTSNINALSNCRLLIRDFSARLEGGYVSGNFAISNFQSPAVRLNTAFSLGLEELSRLIPVPQIVRISGESSGQMQYRHRFESWDAVGLSEILKGEFQGEILCKNVFCQLQETIAKSPVTVEATTLKFNQNHLQVLETKGEFAESKFQTSLFLHNFFGYLGSSELMRVSGDLKIDKIAFIPAGADVQSVQERSLARTTSPRQQTGSQQQGFAIPKNIDVFVRTEVGALDYDNFQLQDLRGHVQYQGKTLFVDELNLKIFDGRLSGITEVNFSDSLRLPFRFEGVIARVNAEKLFVGFDNFGQTEITDKNLSGLIDADLSLVGTYLPGVGLDRKSLWVTVRAKILNGELKNVSMLQKLSRFVDEDTLNHVRFATLENTIEIRNEVVTLPEMRIRSNALSIDVAGTHHFDGAIDYNVKIALSELLSRRRRERRRQQEELGVVEDERRRVSLYVYVTGTTENPQFRYDFKNVFNRLEIGSGAASEAIRRERETVRRVVREEFQFLQKSEETKRQEELWRKQEEGNFVIEWDDETPETPTPTRQRNRRQTKKDTVRIGVLFEDD